MAQNHKPNMPSGYPALAKHLIQKSYEEGINYKDTKKEVKSKYGVDLTEEDYIAIGEYENLAKAIPENESNASNIIKSILVGIVIIIAMKVAGKYIWKAVDAPDSSRPTIQSLIKQIESQEKALLPQKVADNIYVVDIKTTPNTIIYVNEISGLVDLKVLENTVALNGIKNDIAKKLCKEDIFKYILDGGGIVTYQYQLDDGKPFTSINIKKSDCI